jgi:MEMO1 family protein
MDLDCMPSPVEERPGLLIRDPFQFSDATLIVPPQLVACLDLFDGEQTDLDLRKTLVEMTGDLDVGELEEHLINTLSAAGFLLDDTFARMRDECERDFAEAPERIPAHAGTAYPVEEGELRATLNNYMGRRVVHPADGLVGIAAPHVSPFGGWEAYKAGYDALSPEHAERTFVILGTSHQGEPGKFGLTRKPYLTPFGAAATDVKLVDELERRAPDAVKMEDFCHSFEHTIEFQVVFLQHLFGEHINVVPILCGSFFESIYRGGVPEDDPALARFFDTLGDITARESGRLVYVLGIDMAHMGRRYGDRFSALADAAEMTEVAERDQRRIERINAGDSRGFWEQVRENHDDLKWCGSSPLYTFLKSVPTARGELHKYQQWNIDEHSVVSFAGMSFRQA